MLKLILPTDGVVFLLNFLYVLLPKDVRWYFRVRRFVASLCVLCFLAKLASVSDITAVLGRGVGLQEELELAARLPSVLQKLFILLHGVAKCLLFLRLVH